MKKEVRQFLLPLITALYIVLVPLLGLFFRKRVRPVAGRLPGAAARKTDAGSGNAGILMTVRRCSVRGSRQCISDGRVRP